MFASIRQLLKTVTLRLPKRTQQALRKWSYARQIRRGAFDSEEQEYSLLNELLNPGDWALDIGANVGCYTAKMSQAVGGTGRVFAFEPIPDTFGYLTANAQLFRHHNVTLLNVAASDSSRLESMETPTASNGIVQHHRAHIVNSPSDCRVFTMSVDQLALPHKVALVKIDAEGHELSVLKGMRQLLLRDFPVLIVEANSKAVAQWLAALGYDCQVAPESWNYLCRHVRDREHAPESRIDATLSPSTRKRTDRDHCFLKNLFPENHIW